MTGPVTDYQPEDEYEVTVRVVVRRSRDGKQVGPQGFAAFELPAPVSAVALCEAALEAAKLRAVGFGGPTAAVSRIKVAVRELARADGVRRTTALVVGALRRSAQALEEKAVATAATTVPAVEPDPGDLGP